MKPSEKLDTINEKIKLLNENIYTIKEWKLSFENKGANNYCLVITYKKKEIFCGSFATYGSVLSALELIECMFKGAIKKRQEEKKNGKV